VDSVLGGHQRRETVPEGPPVPFSLTGASIPKARRLELIRPRIMR
jgi:hypothetical protein